MNRNVGLLLSLPLITISQSVHAKNLISIEDAQAILFPDATAAKKTVLSVSDDQKKAIKKIAGVRQRWDTQQVWRMSAGEALLGWFIVDEVVGKHEYITYSTAISKSGEVIGIEILSYRETHGGEIIEQDWRENFKGKKLGDKFKLNKDVPNISGATLSCRNVLDGVHRLLALTQVMLINE